MNGYYSIGQFESFRGPSSGGGGFMAPAADFAKVGTSFLSQKWQTDLDKKKLKYQNFALEQKADLSRLNAAEQAWAKADIAKINAALVSELTIEGSRQNYKKAVSLATLVVVESALLGLFFYIKKKNKKRP